MGASAQQRVGKQGSGPFPTLGPCHLLPGSEGPSSLCLSIPCLTPALSPSNSALCARVCARVCEYVRQLTDGHSPEQGTHVPSLALGWPLAALTDRVW